MSEADAAWELINKLREAWCYAPCNYREGCGCADAIAEAIDGAINAAVLAERERCCQLVHGHCSSDNTAARTGLNIGDRLTDNAMTADDYRFHDVFHYAYVAVLTWSPVIRSLFRLKRKSDPKIDEAQDGARAALIEEGVATWIFGQAVSLDFFASVKAGELLFDMLKHVRQFVAGYEAEQIPLWLWEDAILQGYTAFRFLREHRRGRLHIDTNNRRLTIETLP